MMRMVKKLWIAVIVAALSVSAFGVSAAEQQVAGSFKDVPAGHWAASVIREAVGKGYVAGYPDGTFKPDRNVTRAEFMKMLVSALGLPHSQDGGPWYRPYVAALVETNVHQETDFTDYDRPITRLEMSRLVARGLAMQQAYAGLSNVFSYLSGEQLPFADRAEIPDGDVRFVALAYGADILTGYPDETFRPGRSATRAEAVAMLARLDAARQADPEKSLRIAELRRLAEESGAPRRDQVSVSTFLSEVLKALGRDPGSDPVIEALNLGIYRETIGEAQGVTRLEASRILARALALNPDYDDYLRRFGTLYNGDIPVVDWKELKQEDVPYVALVFGALVFGWDEDASYGFGKKLVEGDLPGLMERFRHARSKRPNEFQYLRELKEVAETGTNARAVADFIVYRNLQTDPLTVEHVTDHVTTLKRLYVIPLTSDVVSMYEPMFVWDRSLLRQQRINDELDGIVAGVAEITFKRDRGAYGTNLIVSPVSFVPAEVSDLFGFDNAFSFNYVPSKKGETKLIVLHAGYSNNNKFLQLQLLNSLKRYDASLLDFRGPEPLIK